MDSYTKCLVQLQKSGFYGFKVLEIRENAKVIVANKNDVPEHLTSKYGYTTSHYFSICSDGKIFELKLKPWNF